MVVCIRAGKKQFKKSLQIIRFFCSEFKMSFDSKEARLVDRVRATAFFEAKEAGATFITKKMGGQKIKSIRKIRPTKLEKETKEQLENIVLDLTKRQQEQTTKGRSVSHTNDTRGRRRRVSERSAHQTRPPRDHAHADAVDFEQVVR